MINTTFTYSIHVLQTLLWFKDDDPSKFCFGSAQATRFATEDEAAHAFKSDYESAGKTLPEYEIVPFSSNR